VFKIYIFFINALILYLKRNSFFLWHFRAVKHSSGIGAVVRRKMGCLVHLVRSQQACCHRSCCVPRQKNTCLLKVRLTFCYYLRQPTFQKQEAHF